MYLGIADVLEFCCNMPMARPVRIQYPFPGATYHVVCRGYRREAIFLGDGDRELLLETFACNRLALARFTSVRNIVNGTEGDGHGDAECERRGGWKNIACHGTKDITPERVVLPAGS